MRTKSTNCLFLLMISCWVSGLACDAPPEPVSRPAPNSDSPPPITDESRAEPSPSAEHESRGALAAVVVEGTPQVVVEESHFHFGHMDPLSFGEHSFVVRNQGTGPLRFGPTRSTCKCTISETPQDPVPAGGEASIRVRWQTAENKAHFLESATVTTNDPQQPELRLSIEGSVLVHVTAVPPELVLPGIGPDKTPITSTTIASQVWDHFTIDQLESSLEGIQWELTEASPGDLTELEARAGYRLKITLPDDLPTGDFQHWVRFRIDPQQPSLEAKEYELPLRGKVLRRLAVYGPGVDHTGTVRLGVIPSANGTRHRLLVKTRDPEPDIRLHTVLANPTFLNASLTPVTGVANGLGLFNLEIIIPPQTAACRHQGTETGELLLQFDHPRIPQLKLRVDFAVADRLVSTTTPMTPGE